MRNVLSTASQERLDHRGIQPSRNKRSTVGMYTRAVAPEIQLELRVSSPAAFAAFNLCFSFLETLVPDKY